MQDRICRIDENLLQRTAGPYIGVKQRRTQCEQMSSGSTLKADLAQSRRHFAFGPIGDLTDNFTALFDVLT